MNLACARHDWRRQGIREEVWPGPLPQESGDATAGSGVAAGSPAQGLPQGGVDDVDPAGPEPEVRLCPAARGPEESRGVAVVHKDQRIISANKKLFLTVC